MGHQGVVAASGEGHEGSVKGGQKGRVPPESVMLEGPGLLRTQRSARRPVCPRPANTVISERVRQRAPPC